jgi:hypothetical protein
VAASEIRLDEVARHVVDATARAMPRKRQNVGTLPASVQPAGELRA